MLAFNLAVGFTIFNTIGVTAFYYALTHWIDLGESNLWYVKMMRFPEELGEVFVKIWFPADIRIAEANHNILKNNKYFGGLTTKSPYGLPLFDSVTDVGDNSHVPHIVPGKNDLFTPATQNTPFGGKWSHISTHLNSAVANNSIIKQKWTPIASDTIPSGVQADDYVRGRVFGDYTAEPWSGENRNRNFHAQDKESNLLQNATYTDGNRNTRYQGPWIISEDALNKQEMIKNKLLTIVPNGQFRGLTRPSLKSVQYFLPPGRSAKHIQDTKDDDTSHPLRSAVSPAAPTEYDKFGQPIPEKTKLYNKEWFMHQDLAKDKGWNAYTTSSVGYGWNNYFEDTEFNSTNTDGQPTDYIGYIKRYLRTNYTLDRYK